MTGPRYVLARVTGYPINISRHHHRASDTRDVGPGVTVSVLDRAFAHREVAIFESRSNTSGRGQLSRALALKRATQLCDRLNRLEADRDAEGAA